LIANVITKAFKLIFVLEKKTKRQNNLKAIQAISKSITAKQLISI